ncbi:GNAT family N-acetyltransferase [Pseudemcibacter aquimaris]|uniref:GNAT family N-acetyltransferase n=1 Tax=Pseudemcibacter aquimaris TaxID=2857064 RepID=UPI002011CFA1|nr:GNAT family N-acetyltransferase [Pseudemcibacter aquimaris]MCC3859904.1 GNAT family N-acetyltransferase [Pseudemcibacter aquimaris]WDU57236.1 GNAT family N-acetyltransferase [Pseudemcibacter aquimaris]
MNITQYQSKDRDAVLSIFDKNCPDFFAPNERDDYLEFLDEYADGYRVCVHDDKIVGAFGLYEKDNKDSRLQWILLDPDAQGIGLGTMIMDDVLKQAGEFGVKTIQIATSHVAFKFFEKHGATIVSEVENGWGPGMHQVHMEIRV